MAGSDFYRLGGRVTSQVGKPYLRTPAMAALEGISPTDVPYTDEERFSAQRVQAFGLEDRQRRWEAQMRGDLGQRPMSTNTRSPMADAQFFERLSPAWAGFGDAMAQTSALAAGRGLKGKVSPIGRSAMPTGSRQLSLDSSPALRALGGVAGPSRQMPEDSNPVLRRHLNDRVMQRMLQQLNDEIYQDTPQFVPAGSPTPGGGVTGQPFAFRPREGEAYGAEQRERRAGMQDRESLEALDAFYQPQAALRELDLESRGRMRESADTARSYWRDQEPIEAFQHGRGLETIRARGEAAGFDDQIRADAAFRVAQENARARIAAGDSPEKVVADMIANLSRSGAFGRSVAGQPGAPPPEVSQAASQAVSQGVGRMQGQPQGQPGAAGAPMGAAPGAQYPPEIERAIARGLQLGQARSREEAIAMLRADGVIP